MTLSRSTNIFSKYEPMKNLVIIVAEKLVRRLEREIEKQEAAISELDARVQAAAADYQELSRLMEEKEQAEAVLMDLMEQWEAAQS